MLKTSKSTKSLTQPEKRGVGVGGESKDGYDQNKVDKSEIDDGEVRQIKIWKKGQKIFKFKNSFKF